MTSPPKMLYRTGLGEAWLGDSLEWLDSFDDGEIDLVCTSPPFALTRKKEYGNESEDAYVAWFRKFAERVQVKLAESGSFVIDLGGAWLPGSPTRSLYQYRLLIELVDKVGFHLAEDFYWFNRAKLPGPRQWVNIERTRVKDAVNLIWWLSKTDQPKASNLRVLRPYSESMRRMIAKGKYNDGDRPSQHSIGKTWAKDQGGAIAPNVIEATVPLHLHGDEPDNVLDYSNTASKDPYLKFCREHGMRPHPARFPRQVPEFFVKFLTERGDLVVDIFGGSNMTGWVAERHGRRWKVCEMEAAYLSASVGRFHSSDVEVTPDGRAAGIAARTWSTPRIEACSDRCCQ